MDYFNRNPWRMPDRVPCSICAAQLPRAVQCSDQVRVRRSMAAMVDHDMEMFILFGDADVYDKRCS